MRTDECNQCLRYRDAMTCDAFPDSIPEVIATGMVSHVKPYPGDHGLQFESAIGGDVLVKADALIEHVNDLVDREDIAYSRVKTVLKRKGYTEGDFDIGGALYGRSTNELINMARPRSE